ncbi:hypothetical protein BDR26DRAFT_879914 [Obelidium mucronatum]|nr:hypothetical protein BDR26DRAFT_879914 [Obelidium mucronatum]
MEAEKLRLQELLKEKRRLANQAAIASWSLDQTGDPNQDALNEEGVSLDYALDDFLASVTNQNLDISAQSPPRGMSALYKVSRSPSPVRSVPRKQEDEDEDGILKLYGSSSYTAPTTGKPTPWKLQTDQQITIFDIAPQTANRLTDTTISENIQPDHQLNHAGDEALDQNDEEAIIIQHVTHPSRGTSPQPPFNTQDAEMQTTISQPTRITVPSRLATSIRKGRERFNRIKSLGYLGNPEFEPIDAIQLLSVNLGFFYSKLTHHLYH